MTDQITDLGEARMIQRAPKGPLPFSEEDRAYVQNVLEEIEAAFGLAPFAEVSPGQWPAKALLKQLFEWWRTVVPTTEVERAAFNRIPATIRLINMVSLFAQDQAKLRRP